MLRVAIISVVIVVLDLALLWMGWIAPAEMNQLELSRAYAAQADHPSRETDDALARLQKATWAKQFEIGVAFSAGAFFVTAAGFFLVGRRFERRH